MSQQEESARLKMLRAARKDEYIALTKSNLYEVLQRTIGLLTDQSSSGITLRIGGPFDDASYTDGKTIVLGLPDQFFDLQYGPLDQAMVFKTLLAHEVQHINSSSFKELEKIQEDYAAYMVPKGLPKETACSVAKTMLNILEDGRIENIIMRKLPGFRVPFLVLNNEIRRMGALDAAAIEPGQEYADFHNEILSYAKTGRHLPNIQVYAGSRLETEFRAIQGDIDAAIVSVAAKDCANWCRSMLWKIADYILELMKSKAAQQKASQLGGGDPEYTTDQEREFNPDVPDMPSSPAEAGPNGIHAANGEGEEDEDGDSEGRAGDDGGKIEANCRRLPERMFSDRSGDWTDDFSEASKDGYLPMTFGPRDLEIIRQGISREIAPQDAPEPVEDREVKRVEARYKKESVRTFEESFPKIPLTQLPPDLLSTAKRLEQDIKKVLHQKHSERRGTRSGILDTGALYRARVKDPHIFYKRGAPLKADMAAFLLLDNSGSMASVGSVVETAQGRERISRSSLSRSAAAVIEYALRDLAALKISLFDVGGGKVRHATLKRFDEKTDGGRLYGSMDRVDIGCGNKDGYSIRVATQDLLARRESMKILVVLSDGLPSDYNGGEAAGMADVQNAVKEARAKGVRVIPIMFGDAAFRKNSIEDFTYMYKSFISCDPVDIIDEFRKLFRGLVKKS